MIWASLFSMANAGPLQAHLLYFVLVDRFENGDKTNDVAVDLRDPQAFHGGDLQGLTSKLPYIQKLGADAIWLSPIFHMRTTKFEGHGAFHGYWVQNLDAIEPAFGGEEALLALAQESEKQGISLIMDMVYNHVSFDSPMRETHKEWFHEEKTIVDWNDPYELTHYQVHGLPDLDQSNEEVYTYLRTRSEEWRNKAQLSGFRIDAIRHMENDFLSRLATDLHKDNTWLLGEDFQGNPVALIDRAKKSGLDSFFDFPNYYAMTDLFCKDASVGAFAGNLWLDHQYPKDLQLVTFLDNHDLPRLHSLCSPEQAMQAMFTQFSVRGLPMITYGTEVGLQGMHEPENRIDMRWNVVHPLQSMIQELTALRKAHPVLERGSGFVEYLDQNIMIYTQFLDGESASLAINRSDSDFSHSHPLGNCRQVTTSFSTCTTPTIPANSVRMWLDKREYLPSKKIRSEIHVSPCSPAQDLRLVGSAPILGGWNPHKGLSLVERDGVCHASLLIEEQAVLRFKVVKIENNAVTWGQGPDHILWNKANLSIAWKP